jgi:hypothetical protein
MTNLNKTYTIATADGNLVYGYYREYRKWMFKSQKMCVLVKCKGNEQGHKVANIIAGSIKRCGELDNMARANIDRVIGS